jgi:hypothetical protein
MLGMPGARVYLGPGPCARAGFSFFMTLPGVDTALRSRRFITYHPALYVAALWERIIDCLRVGNWSFWGSGRPRGPRRPKRWGASPPTFCKGLRGIQGRPDVQNDRFPTLKSFENFTAIQSAATYRVNGGLNAKEVSTCGSGLAVAPSRAS